MVLVQGHLYSIKRSDPFAPTILGTNYCSQLVYGHFYSTKRSDPFTSAPTILRINHSELLYGHFHGSKRTNPFSHKYTHVFGDMFPGTVYFELV